VVGCPPFGRRRTIIVEREAKCQRVLTELPGQGVRGRFLDLCSGGHV
jgi:hypothetical protein